MNVNVPGQGVITFPDDAKDEEIQSFLNEAFPQPSAEDTAKFAIQQSIDIPSRVIDTLQKGAEGSEMGRQEMTAERALYALQMSQQIPQQVMSTLEKGAFANQARAKEIQQFKAVDAMSPSQALAHMRFAGAGNVPSGEEILDLSRQAAGAIGKVTEPVFEGLSRVGSDLLNITGLDPSAEPGRPLFNLHPKLGGLMDPAPEQIYMAPFRKFMPEAVAGVEKGLGEVGTPFTEPGQLLAIPALMMAGGPVNRAASILFGSQMFAELPEQVQEAVQTLNDPNSTIEQKTAAITRPGVSALMGKTMLQHGLMPEAPKGAKEGGVPSEAGSTSPAPEAKPVEEPGVKLQAQNESITKAAASNKQMGLPFETVDSGPVDPNSPFAGEIATVDSQGRILLNREKLSGWLDRVLPENRQKALDSLFSEEGIHAIARKLFTDDQMAGLWNGLTSVEKALVETSYFGKARTEARPNYTDAQMGHEYLRRSMQRLLRTDIREVAELRGKSGAFKEHFIDMAERVIQAVRKLLQTEPSKTLEAMLKDMEDKVQAAKTGEVPEGRAPAAFAKDDPDSLVPALKDPEGKLYIGNRGDNHKHIYDAQPHMEGLMLKVSEPEHGFWDGEKFISRSEAAQRLGQKEDLHSERLNELQQAKAPAAFSKKETEGQMEFILPPRKEAKAAPAAKEIQPLTPEALEGAALKHLTEEVAPDFSDFKKEAAKQFGGEVKPGLLRDVWQTGTWKRLLAATGSELQNMAKTAGLQKFFGETVTEKGRIPDAPTPEEIAQRDKMAPDVRRERLRELNRRYNVIARLGENIIADSETGRKRFERADVSPEDIADPHFPTKEKAWNTFSTLEQADPVKLGDRLVADARAFGGAKLTKTLGGQKVEITQKGLPVSVTKRLTVLQNKADGKVSMVSTFRDGRRGPVMIDPQHPAGKHQPVSEVMKRYRVVHSVLLDEPVKNFRQDFANLKDFSNQFGREAAQQAAKTYEEPSGEQAVEEYRGPRLDRPITDAEAKSIIDHNLGEVGKVTGPEDILSAIEALKERPNRQAISGYGKLAAQVLRENPELSTEDVLRKVAYQVYENHIESQKLRPSEREAEFQRRTMAQGPAADRGLAGPSVQAKPEYRAPAAFSKEREALEEHWATLTSALNASVKRHSVKQDMARILDGTDNESANFALNAGNHIRQVSGGSEEYTGKGNLFKRFKERRSIEKRKQQIREAAVAVLASGEIEKPGSLFEGQWFANPKHLKTLFTLLEAGETKARDWIKNGNIVQRRYGKRWLKEVEKMREGVRYAADNWKSKVLHDTAEAIRYELKATLKFENANGSSLQDREHYYPGRYEGAFWSDNGINFGGFNLLGTAFKNQKKFSNPYEAIANGPYIQASLDSANVVEHRVRAGHRIVERRMWVDTVKKMIDPDTGKPIAVNPVAYSVDVTDPATGEVTKELRWRAPDPSYELVSPFGHQKPIAVRRGFAKMVRSLTAKSHVEDIPLAKEALIVGSQLKHGVILIADTFHVGRVGQYAASLIGADLGFTGGHTALAYRPEDLPGAVRQGMITKESADWAMGPVEVSVTRKLPGGKSKVEKVTMTRMELAKEFNRQGLNAMRISDALYRDAVQNIPFIGEAWHKAIGPVNNWIFGQYMPGLIVESAIHNFEKFNKARPDIPVHRLMKDVLMDVNVFFGSMGRQGIFKNATFRDFAQIFLLAPSWQEGLLQKELRFYGRLSGVSQVTGRAGLPRLGTLGSGMANGLLFYAGVTQLINLITRRQFTWQNEEEGHKFDAWIPTGGGKGFWLSPLAVFAEVLHDLLRLNETKPTVADAIAQMGANRLGPVGKMGYIFVTGKNSQGELYTSSRSRVLGAVSQVVPFVGPGPISFSGPARAVAHQLFPNQVSPPPRGTLVRQAFASLAGIKVQPGDTANQMMTRAAQKWGKENHVKKTTGWQQVMTDEPSYSKLRNAIRNDDPRGAKQYFDALKKEHTDLEIVKSMYRWSRNSFTGSKKGDRQYFATLDDWHKDLWTRALEERQETLNAFIRWYKSQP